MDFMTMQELLLSVTSQFKAAEEMKINLELVFQVLNKIQKKELKNIINK